MKNIIKKLVSKVGYEIIRKNPMICKDGIPIDITEKSFIDAYYLSKDFSLTSVETLYALFKSVEYVIKGNIPGDFVECGVWKGGSAMMIAHTLMQLNITNRKIILYDTFEGMTEPSDIDENFNGEKAKQLIKKENKNDDRSVWCYCSIDDVKKNLASTGYPMENIIFVKGKVEDTIPQQIPEKISLLRLDTDWFESTYHELHYLFPLLSGKGVLIIDDYGHWKGAREAVNKYFAETKQEILLNRIDYTVRVGIKS
jgi:hypothetical protein